MRVTEIRALSAQDITKQLAEAQKTLQDLRFSLAFKQLVNTASIKNTKRLIAKLYTVLKEKEVITKN